MRLTLKVSTYCDQPPTDPQIRSFDSFPIIVGRSNACDYCLDDASRYISSNHAVIVQENGTLLLQDTSANGVYVNGATEPLGRGHNLALSNEDSLAIGDYTLSVAIESSAAPGAEVDDPFDDFAYRATDPGSAAPPATYDPFRGDEPDWTPPSAQPPDPFSDDWDMNDTPVQGQPGSSATGDGNWADWTDDADSADHPDRAAGGPEQRGSAKSSPVDDDYDWLPGTSSETVSIPAPLAGAGKHAEPSRSRPNQADSPVRSSGRSASAQEQRSVRARLTPSPPPSSQTPARQASTQPANRHFSNPAASLDILLRAASLRETDFSHLDDTEVLEQTGRLLLHMVDAMMVLLQSRAELKNAIRSDVTTLSRSGNNPLKFSVNSVDALTKLLANDTEGYLQADNAVQEAVDDLKLHQLAMLEGMKSAVRSLLVQFDPNLLARELEKTGGLTANIPITREAKLWELFCEQYDAIRDEAVNNFADLFGTEFRKAYEKRIMKMGRKPDF